MDILKSGTSKLWNEIHFVCGIFFVLYFILCDISLKFKDSYGREISIENFLFYKWLQNIYNLSDQHHLRK